MRGIRTRENGTLTTKGRLAAATVAALMASCVGAPAWAQAVLIRPVKPFFVDPSDEPLVREPARTLEVGPGRALQVPSRAIAMAHPGDTVRIWPGRYDDCAVLTRNNVTIEGMGRPGDVVMSGRVCEDKALLVVRASNATVRNVTLANARAPEGNGAGIRQEGPNLTVDGVTFSNNESGILTAPTTGTLTIRNSTFDGNGRCAQGCAHAVYANAMDRLVIERTTFRNTRQGHDVKTKARTTSIADSSMEDGPNGTASYAIEVPVGGGLTVRGTRFEKGPETGNRSYEIVLGTEGIEQRTPFVRLSGNRFRNDTAGNAVFVLNRTATPAELSGNILEGNGTTPLQGDGTVR